MRYRDAAHFPTHLAKLPRSPPQFFAFGSKKDTHTPQNIMAQLGNDERAPGVSSALRNRIGSLLDAGERPALRGTNLRIGNVVLGRSDGRDAPAMAEVRLQM